MKRVSKRIVIVNALGALGYVGLLVAWAFFVSIIIIVLIDASIVQPAPTQSVGLPVEPASSGGATAIAYIVTVLAIIATIGVLMGLPYIAGRWGAKLTRLLLRFLKAPLGHRELLVCKLGLVLAASLGMYLTSLFTVPESSDSFAMPIGGAVIAVAATLVFTLQHWVAKKLSVQPEKTW